MSGPAGCARGSRRPSRRRRSQPPTCRGWRFAKANAVALKRFHPEGVETLRAAHRRFTAAVEANQTVLDSARSVSEGLIKSLAEEIGRAQMPTGYGRQTPAPSPYGRGVRSGPLVLSRNL
jgi:hypothetical protein